MIYYTIPGEYIDEVIEWLKKLPKDRNGRYTYRLGRWDKPMSVHFLNPDDALLYVVTFGAVAVE